MSARLELLSYDLVARVLDEAFQLMQKPGVKVQSAAARRLLLDAGAAAEGEVVAIPEKTVRRALDTTPAEFRLYDGDGWPQICYGGDTVQFVTGSCAVNILDSETGEHRPARVFDLVRITKITELLPQIQTQSTATTCAETPKTIGDIYRLYILLTFSKKPIVTGAFSLQTLESMIEMLALSAGGEEALTAKPRAIFDVCPSPPLIWSEFGAENLIILARRRVPAQIVSMPLAGAAAPVTLLGAIVQHTAECLSGITIHQLANPGAPIVWGGAPAIFDMRRGTTPMGAIETAMIDAACAQVGKSLNLPTHAYLGASDAKVVDAQAGLESGITALIGALAGINMIAGVGMLDFLACQSAEKLVLDAEGIAMAQRLLTGIEVRTETLATALFEGIDFQGNFLKQRITRDLFAKEQYLPSAVIDRDTLRGWQQSGRQDAFARARARADELEAKYERPLFPAEQERALREMMTSLARQAGMDSLPDLGE